MPDPEDVRKSLAEVDDMRRMYRRQDMSLDHMVSIRGMPRIFDFIEAAARAWLAEQDRKEANDGT